MLVSVNIFLCKLRSKALLFSQKRYVRLKLGLAGAKAEMWHGHNIDIYAMVIILACMSTRYKKSSMVLEKWTHSQNLVMRSRMHSIFSYDARFTSTVACFYTCSEWSMLFEIHINRSRYRRPLESKEVTEISFHEKIVAPIHPYNDGALSLFLFNSGLICSICGIPGKCVTLKS